MTVSDAELLADAVLASVASVMPLDNSHVGTARAVLDFSQALRV